MYISIKKEQTNIYFTKENIVSTFEKLCEKNILNVKVQAGKETYRITTNRNQDTTKLDIERVEIDDNDIDDDINVSSDTVIMTSQQLNNTFRQNKLMFPKTFKVLNATPYL